MKNRHLITPLILLAVLLLHLPFLHADPDSMLGIGRDAFTDEGLNTSQIRNVINHHTLNLNECDNMIKSPLFNVILYLPLLIFGTHWVVARLTVLVFFLLLLWLACREKFFRQLIPVFAATTLLQYYVFQYSHFSLSEMVAVGCITAAVVSLFHGLNAGDAPHHWRLSLVPSAWCACAYFLKIQFAYIVLLPPLCILLWQWTRYSNLKQALRSMKFLASWVWLLGFAAPYVLFWYLPFASTFNYVMHDETGQKFASLLHFPETMLFNAVHFLFSAQSWWFSSLVIICFLAGIFLWRHGAGRSFRVFFLISCVWMLLECHKLGMTYLPSRYMVSFYAAAGLLSATILLQLFRSGYQQRTSRAAGMVLLAMFLAGNGLTYAKLLIRRTYHIENINRYFAASIKNDVQPVMGPWAPGATWKCKAPAIPVWKDFMNDKNIIERFHPQAIISEPDESESNGAYRSQGMNLTALSDSSRSFEIGKWTLIVYWIRK